MSTQKSRRLLIGLVAGATAAALVMPGAAFAKGPGIPGGGGGGGRPGVEASNNLSVPAIFVGANPYGLICGEDSAVAPEEITENTDPLDGYPDDPDLYYYVQGEHEWQADCLDGQTSAAADAAWGDNLAGDAMLKVGKPIRVEIGLNAGDMGMTGWLVEKLDEDALDREAPYGTQAFEGDTWTTDARTPFFTVVEDEVTGEESDVYETRVWAANTWLKITGPEGTVVDELATAEINATGRVVYGYNLRVSAAGEYLIEYTFPNVELTGNDVGDIEGNKASLKIEVVPGGGKGGGGGKPTK